MTAILTAAEMRALERAAIESGAVTGLELMERAGRGVVEAILAEWPDIEAGAKRAVVLCGPGNNGGDGFVVARLLKERGWAVEAFLYGDAERLPPDARVNWERWISMGAVRPLDDAAERHFGRAYDDITKPDLWIDAIFGTGLTRQASLDVGRAFESIKTGFSEMVQGPVGKVVALDIPSGIDADSGVSLFQQRAPGPAIIVSGPNAGTRIMSSGLPLQPLRSDLTLAFHAYKCGHFLGRGPEFIRKLALIDIGLCDQSWWQRTQLTERPRDGWTGGLAKHAGHKFTHGHALILSGGAGRGGAARLAARGALRIGAGLVTLAVPPAVLQENAARLDAIMLRSVRDPEALVGLLADARLNALCVGPGFGTADRQAAMLAALLEAAGGAEAENGPPVKPRPVVLDADALALLARDPALRAKLHVGCVLTPHEGEFARLFPGIDAKWRAPALTGPAFSKVDAAREAAREAGCVVLLKGPDTVIADPTGRVAINAAVCDRAAPWLATAGSGDVLAGFITGLLARGFPPFDAACTAAWLHVECARSFGPGLIAEDLPEELPKVFRALGL